jgi:uncharacterized peroxidase-related enzyme
VDRDHHLTMEGTMGNFTRHTPESAPAETADVLSQVRDRYGFVPNLAAYLAESPASLDAVLRLQEAFDRTSLTPEEQQLVLLTVSATNACSYCTTVHTALARRSGLGPDAIRAVRERESIADRRLGALRDFVVALVAERGRVGDRALDEFLAAGYTRAQAFEVVMGVALKTFTNYCNHLAGAEPNAEFVAMASQA